MVQHDLNHKGCLNFCEFSWFWEYSKSFNNWLGFSEAEIYFEKADHNKDCCVDLTELKWFVEAQGGFKGAGREGPRYSAHYLSWKGGLHYAEWTLLS